MKYLVILFLSFSLVQEVKSQASTGVKFETTPGWAEVKAKAKKENKYIFLDAYTTWCVPCREMAISIFPKPEVGDFFNRHFINVAVQFDVTENDNAQIKKWHKEVKRLQDTYKIEAYPTYLFFNPDGELIHRITGGTKVAADFLEKAKMALDPKRQYSTLKKQYKSGKRDTTVLLSLIKTARASAEMDSIEVYINDYLAIDKNWFKKQNLEFIVLGTTKSTDIGFDFLRSHQSLIDSVAGKNSSKEILQVIAYDEIILPLIRENGKKKNYGGGMVVYSGEVIKGVDWNMIKAKLDPVYPELSEEIIQNSKPSYYQSYNDWDNFSRTVSLYAADKKKLDLDKLDNYGRTVAMFCEDQKFIQEAIRWSEQILTMDEKTPWYLKTYSYLLYKSGQKDLAIRSMEKFIERTPITPAVDDARKDIEKMKKGEKI